MLCEGVRFVSLTEVPPAMPDEPATDLVGYCGGGGATETIEQSKPYRIVTPRYHSWFMIGDGLTDMLWKAYKSGKLATAEGLFADQSETDSVV